MYPRILTWKERKAVRDYFEGRRRNDAVIRQLVSRYRKSAKILRADTVLLELLVRKYESGAQKAK